MRAGRCGGPFATQAGAACLLCVCLWWSVLCRCVSQVRDLIAWRLKRFNWGRDLLPEPIDVARQADSRPNFKFYMARPHVEGNVVEHRTGRACSGQRMSALSWRSIRRNRLAVVQRFVRAVKAVPRLKVHLRAAHPACKASVSSQCSGNKSGLQATVIVLSH